MDSLYGDEPRTMSQLYEEQLALYDMTRAIFGFFTERQTFSRVCEDINPPPNGRGTIQMHRAYQTYSDSIVKSCDEENFEEYLNSLGEIEELHQMELVDNKYKKLVKLFTAESNKAWINPRDFDYAYRSLTQILNRQKRRKKDKLISIEPVIDPKEPMPYVLQLSFAKKEMIEHDRTGTYKLTFDDDDVLFYDKWEIGMGRSRLIDVCAVGTPGAFRKLEEANALRKVKQRRPKKGIYIANVTPQGLVIYDKYKPQPDPVIHEAKNAIFASIEMHFKNLVNRKFHTRTLLLPGQQGTGKSQILAEIALHYAKTHCVVFTDSLSCMFQHEILAAEGKVPTIIFLEEAEEAIAKYNPGQGFDRVNTSVKNMMSGFLTEKNKAGTYKIYTTNHPDRIDKTILNRRERVDEIIHVGPLNEIDAGRVALLYLGSSMPKGDIGSLFNNMTGCDIKYICKDVVENSEANGNIDDNGVAIVTYNALANAKKDREDGYHHAINFNRKPEEGGPL